MQFARTLAEGDTPRELRARELRRGLRSVGSRGYLAGTVKASDLLQRALQFLGRGDEDVAEATLLDAVEQALVEEEIVTLTRARLALGELLLRQERGGEADPYLHLVIRTERADGSVHAEVRRAAALLATLRGWRVD